MMKTESLIGRLRMDLRPVRPRSLMRDATVLPIMSGIAVVVFPAMSFMRPDRRVAIGAPSFWWKMVSMGLVAVLGGGTALVFIDPIRSPRQGLRRIIALITAVLVTGWLIDAGRGRLSLLRHYLNHCLSGQSEMSTD